MGKLLPLHPIINNILAIQITYRRTSRLSMRIVKNGDVHVSAPIGLSRDRVIAFIEEHRDWISEARQKTSERQQRRNAFYDKLPLTTRAQADDALRRLKALIEPMVELHAKEMGVRPSRVFTYCYCPNGVPNMLWCTRCATSWNQVIMLVFMPSWTSISHVGARPGEKRAGYHRCRNNHKASLNPHNKQQKEMPQASTSGSLRHF